MDSKKIKLIILFIIAMIVILLILISQVFMTGKIIEKNEQVLNANKQEKEEVIIDKLSDSKIYKNVISKIDNNNFYIDMEIDKYTNEKIIVAMKDYKIYVSSGNIDIISISNTLYVVNHDQKIISEKKDARLLIRDIIDIPDPESYENLKITEGSEYITDKRYNSENIDSLEYFFDNEELKYIRNVNEKNTFYKVNSISEVFDESIFNLPIDYDIIDGSSIDVNEII